MLGVFLVMNGRSVFSRVLAIGERREMGRKEALSLGGLLAFCLGSMCASFQMCGMVFVLSARLNKCVMYWMAIGPRCLRCCMLMLSGPTEVFVLLFLIAMVTSFGVIVMFSDVSLCVVRSILLLSLCVECFVVCVNCLLNAVAILW